MIGGGLWKDLMDYHHFQTPRYLAFLLAEMTAEDAITFFEWYVDHPEVVLDEDNILKDYKKNPQHSCKSMKNKNVRSSCCVGFSKHDVGKSTSS
ncbi:MAG: hypothetical protein H6925_01890 [Holosporaceae bacterium]|nr:MAG: hypothetical protein H6925_01890 [Holosporaceae bacterium]